MRPHHRMKLHSHYKHNLGDPTTKNSLKHIVKEQARQLESNYRSRGIYILRQLRQSLCKQTDSIPADTDRPIQKS